MRIVVCVKRVYDPATVKVSRSREELDLRGAHRITNRPDRYALEAALRLRAALGGEVIALTVGDAEAEDTAHEAVATGADRALLIEGPALGSAGSAVVTRALVAALDHLAPVDLVLTGQSGQLDGTGALPARLAAALGWPVVLDVARLGPGSAGELEALVPSSLPGEAYAISLPCPGVASIAPGPERPRYAHAARIANAWASDTVEVCTPADLGLAGDALVDDVEVGGLILGPERTRGEVLGGTVDESAGALFDLLHTRKLMA